MIHLAITIGLLMTCIVELLYIRQFQAKIPKPEPISQESKSKPCKYKDCDIEYLPITNKYRARYKKCPIYQCSSTTGEWIKENQFISGVLFSTEAQAKDYLDLFLEQSCRISKIIKLC